MTTYPTSFIAKYTHNEGWEENKTCPQNVICNESSKKTFILEHTILFLQQILLMEKFHDWFSTLRKHHIYIVHNDKEHTSNVPK